MNEMFVIINKIVSTIYNLALFYVFFGKVYIIKSYNANCYQHLVFV